MGFGTGLDTKWEDNQSVKPDSTINRNAIHGGGDLFDFRGEALVVEVSGLHGFSRRFPRLPG
jgi:hypothetical protein